jgi:hypothetical protein
VQSAAADGAADPVARLLAILGLCLGAISFFWAIGWSIYLTEYQRLFMHFVFRSWANRDPSGASAAGRLTEDDSWSAPHYEPGGWRDRQRRTFAGTIQRVLSLGPGDTYEMRSPSRNEERRWSGLRD